MSGPWCWPPSSGGGGGVGPPGPPGAGALTVSPTVISASAFPALDLVHIVSTPPAETPEDIVDVALTLPEGSNADRRFAIDVQSPSSEAGSGTITVSAPGALFESDSGLLVTTFSMPDKRGAYREWVCAPDGHTWYLAGDRPDLLAQQAAVDAHNAANMAQATADAALAAGGGSSGARNLWFTPPVTPSVLFDDDFRDGSPDLAARGWTISNSSGAIMSRIGDVQPFSTAALGSNQYRSTLTALGLMLQTSIAAYIYKPVTPPVTVLVVSGFSRTNSTNGGGAQLFQGGSPFVLDGAARRFFVEINPSADALRITRMSPPFNYWNPASTAFAAHAQRGPFGSAASVDTAATPTVWGWLFDAVSGRMILEGSVDAAGFAPTHGGVEIVANPSGGFVLTTSYIQSIRMAPSYLAFPGLY